MSVTVYGASDDLIEIDGDISEEFDYRADDNKTLLAFSDGTVLSIQYGQGDGAFWRINRLVAGTAKYTKTEATDEDKDYSDKVTLDGDVRWVVCGDRLAKRRAR